MFGRGEKLTEWLEGSVFCILAALRGPDHLWSVTLSPTPQPITRQGQLGLFASPVVLSPSLGQKSRPVVTFRSQPPLNSFGMVAGTEPGQHGLKSILS